MSFSLKHEANVVLGITSLLLVLGGVALAQTAPPPPPPTIGGTPCGLLTSSSPIPTGFAPAYNVFTATRDLLVQIYCTTSGASVSAGTGASDQIVYNTGYKWMASQNQWLPITFTGTPYTGSQVWLAGNGSASISSSQIESGTNYVVAYTCENVNSQWKCGCSDQSCTLNKWQLQEFANTTTGGTTGGGTGGGITSGDTGKPFGFKDPSNPDYAIPTTNPCSLCFTAPTQIPDRTQWNRETGRFANLANYVQLNVFFKSSWPASSVGRVYHLDMSCCVKGGVLPYKYAIEPVTTPGHGGTGHLPPGISLDSHTGLISGTGIALFNIPCPDLNDPASVAAFNQHFFAAPRGDYSQDYVFNPVITDAAGTRLGIYEVWIKATVATISPGCTP